MPRYAVTVELNNSRQILTRTYVLRATSRKKAKEIVYNKLNRTWDETRIGRPIKVELVHKELR